MLVLSEVVIGELFSKFTSLS